MSRSGCLKPDRARDDQPGSSRGRAPQQVLLLGSEAVFIPDTFLHVVMWRSSRSTRRFLLLLLVYVTITFLHGLLFSFYIWIVMRNGTLLNISLTFLNFFYFYFVCIPVCRTQDWNFLWRDGPFRSYCATFLKYFWRITLCLLVSSSLAAPQLRLECLEGTKCFTRHLAWLLALFSLWCNRVCVRYSFIFTFIRCFLGRGLQSISFELIFRTLLLNCFFHKLRKRFEIS